MYYELKTCTQVVKFLQSDKTNQLLAQRDMCQRC